MVYTKPGRYPPLDLAKAASIQSSQGSVVSVSPRPGSINVPLQPKLSPRQSLLSTQTAEEARVMKKLTAPRNPLGPTRRAIALYQYHKAVADRTAEIGGPPKTHWVASHPSQITEWRFRTIESPHKPPINDLYRGTYGGKQFGFAEPDYITSMKVEHHHHTRVPAVAHFSDAGSVPSYTTSPLLSSKSASPVSSPRCGKRVEEFFTCEEKQEKKQQILLLQRPHQPPQPEFEESVSLSTKILAGVAAVPAAMLVGAYATVTIVGGTVCILVTAAACIIEACALAVSNFVSTLFCCGK